MWHVYFLPLSPANRRIFTQEPLHTSRPVLPSNDFFLHAGFDDSLLTLAFSSLDFASTKEAEFL